MLYLCCIRFCFVFFFFFLMIRRPPRSTLSSSSAASDVYKRQHPLPTPTTPPSCVVAREGRDAGAGVGDGEVVSVVHHPLDKTHTSLTNVSSTYYSSHIPNSRHKEL
eukprot:TRINITY_DN15693_c0_g1_i2.p1 TRINITY_DN15693_c0_g1~~TRINITY_DN15693_c0_g1_i2.p1  ORF type:complete len:107 (-),score=26.32 TRINITY_DN15693_c0_g1_i2:156-476(-)